MYKISEFSKITHLTIKALRYYDEQGILVPSQRDGKGYRYYDEKDYEKANLVAHLRGLDFSIAEVKDILLYVGDCPEDLGHVLEEKKEQIRHHIEHEKALIEKINLLNKSIHKEAIRERYTPEIKEIGALKVASISFKGHYSEVGSCMQKLYKTFGNRASGRPFNLYYQEGYMEEARIEACLPIKEGHSQGEIIVKVLEPVKVVSLLYRGPYEKINRSYKEIYDYRTEKHLVYGLPTREVYHKAPGVIFKGNPEEYRTEIQIPIL